MIQFNRYRLMDESPDFHVKFIALTNAIIHEINGDLGRSMDFLKSMTNHYPMNDRLPAVAARLYYWGKCSWEDIKPMLPHELPRGFFYKQEIVGCCGLELSARQWDIDEDKWALYQGFDTHFSGILSRTTGNAVGYQPRSSGFFSVIENIIAAQTIAELDGNEFFIDLTGEWWPLRSHSTRSSQTLGSTPTAACLRCGSITSESTGLKPRTKRRLSSATSNHKPMMK